MHITKLAIRSFRIVRRTSRDTDTLDSGYLHSICELLARAHATLSPLQVGDDDDNPVYLGLGWPEDMQDLRADPSAKQVLGQLFAEMPAPIGTIFYLQHHGSGPIYAVLPAEQDDDDDDNDVDLQDEDETRESTFDDLLAELHSIQSDDLAEKIARFDSMWAEALSSLPAVLQFGPGDWEDHWDEFAMYIAAAILLED